VEILVNNKKVSIPLGFTVIKLLRQIQYSKSVAVFVNGRQLLMAEYDTYLLNEHDVVKVIKPLGGG